MENYQLTEAIAKGNLELALAETNRTLADGIDPQDVINKHLVPGMEEIGKAYEEGKAFVPNLLMSARAMKGALDILKPLLVANCDSFLGKVVIGTVKGDLHDIGKNLVASMLEGCGFEIINLGVNVSREQFAKAIEDNKPDIVCMSALLTTTMVYMKDVVDYLNEKGVRNEVKIMIGGAPVTQEYADKIGADGYTENANTAVTKARQLVA